MSTRTAVAVPADASVLQAVRISLPSLWAALSHLDCLSLMVTLGVSTQRVHERMVGVMPALAADVAAAKTREQVCECECGCVDFFITSDFCACRYSVLGYFSYICCFVVVCLLYSKLIVFCVSLYFCLMFLCISLSFAKNFTVHVCRLLTILLVCTFRHLPPSHLPTDGRRDLCRGRRRRRRAQLGAQRPRPPRLDSGVCSLAMSQSQRELMSE